MYFGMAALACAGVTTVVLLVTAAYATLGDEPTPDGVTLLVLGVGGLGFVQIVLGGVVTSSWSARYVLVGTSAISGAMSLGAVLGSLLLFPVTFSYLVVVPPGMLCAASVDIASVRVALRRDVRDHARAVRQARRSARAATRLVRGGA